MFYKQFKANNIVNKFVRNSGKSNDLGLHTVRLFLFIAFNWQRWHKHCYAIDSCERPAQKHQSLLGNYLVSINVKNQLTNRIAD